VSSNSGLAARLAAASTVLVMAAWCLLLSLGVVVTSTPALAAEESDWQGTDILKGLLADAGFRIQNVSAVPKSPGAGVLVVAVPEPTPEQLWGLWGYVVQGGAVLLPLEVPVALDDPLVNTVRAGRGVKVEDGGDCYAGDAQVPVIQWETGHMSLTLNMPTYLAPFSAPPGVTVSVREISFGPKAYVVGSSSSGRLIAAMDVRAGRGRAVIIADHSVLTNQMIAANEGMLRVLVQDLAAGTTVFWLGPRTPGGGGGSGTPGGGDGEGSAVSGAGGRRGFPWLLVALPLALTPFFDARRRKWRPEDFLSERSTETRFRSLVRESRATDNYRVALRQLAAELGRILPVVLEVGPAKRLSDYIAPCRKAVAERAKGQGGWRRWRAQRHAARLLASLERLSGEALVPGKAFLRSYEGVHRLLNEMGGAHLYADGTVRRHQPTGA
jgi:hypothetical protein